MVFDSILHHDLCCTGTAGLPDRVPATTLERVSFHLAETTSDNSTENLCMLMGETNQTSEPTVRRIIAALLKFQGGHRRFMTQAWGSWSD